MEREIEAVGLGPPRVRQLAGGGVAILDAGGRVHAVVGWELDRSPDAAASSALPEIAAGAA